MEDKPVDEEVEEINREINSLKLPDGAPPKARVPYMRYYHEVFHSIKAANTALRLPEIGKIIGSQWKALPDEEKQRYTRGYEDDKQKFAAAMKIFQITSEYQQYSRRKEELEQRRKRLQHATGSNASHATGHNAKSHSKQHAGGGRASLSRPVAGHATVNGAAAATNGNDVVKSGSVKPATSPPVSMPLYQYGNQTGQQQQHESTPAANMQPPQPMQMYHHQRMSSNNNQMMTPPPQQIQQQQSGWPNPMYASGPPQMVHNGLSGSSGQSLAVSGHLDRQVTTPQQQQQPANNMQHMQINAAQYYQQQQQHTRILAPSQQPPQPAASLPPTSMGAATAAQTIPRAVVVTGNATTMPPYYAQTPQQQHLLRNNISGGNVVRVAHQLPPPLSAAVPLPPAHVNNIVPAEPSTELGHLQAAFAATNGASIPPFDNSSLALLEHLHPADAYAQRRLAGSRLRHNQALMFEIFNSDIINYVVDPEGPAIATETHMQALRQQVVDLEAQRNKVQQEIQELEQVHAAKRQKIQMSSVNSAEQSEQNSNTASRAKHPELTDPVFKQLIKQAFEELEEADRAAVAREREAQEKREQQAAQEAEQALQRKNRVSNKSPSPSTSKAAGSGGAANGAKGGGAGGPKKRGRANVTARKVAQQ